jgi:DnaK suppressor protein
MKHSDLASFRHILETMLQETTRPRVQREDIAVENAPDAVDHSQRQAERDLAILQIESNFNRAQSIKLALDRIEDGSYGTCLMCDGEISPKRLTAVPWTAYCVRCQEIADKERVQPEDTRLQSLLHLKDVA